LKIVAISDTHCQLDKIDLPIGDVLIHAGDLTSSGSLVEVSRELIILKDKGKLFKSIILVAGNHDWLFQREPSLAKQMCKDNDIIYLEDSSTQVDGVTFYGSPWTLKFNNWAFGLHQSKMKMVWDMIPDKVDVLITHSPPKGILDEVVRKNKIGDKKVINEGCEELLSAVLRVKPRFHMFGHLHEAHGTYDGLFTKFRNVAVLDDKYKLVYQAAEIEI
jgi:Icc-related predicted phosphoesterase